MTWIRLIALSWMLALTASAQVLQPVNLGSAINTGSGDPIRTALQKLNNNDSNLWNQAFVVQVATNALVARRKVVRSFAELLTVDPDTTDQVEMLGYYGPGMGGYSIYTRTNTIAGTNALAGRVLALGGLVSWEIIREDGKVTALQFGARGDGVSDDLIPINTLITFQTNNWSNTWAWVEPGWYKVTNSVLIGSNGRLFGVDEQSILLRWFHQTPGRGKADAVLRNLSWQGLTNAFSAGLPEYDTNIVIKGITVWNRTNPGSTTNALFRGPGMAFYFIGDMVLEDVTSYNAEADWNITIKGNRWKANNCSARGSRDLYEDGFHILGGKSWAVNGGFFQNGDDSWAATADWGNPLIGGTVRNIVVDSYRGFGIKVANDNDNTALWTDNGSYIGDITIDGVVGLSGWVRSGGVQLRENPVNSTRKGVIKNVKISNVYLQTGPVNAGNEATWISDGGDCWGVSIRGGTNIWLENVNVTQTYRDGLYIEWASDVTVEGSTIIAPYDTTQNNVDVIGSSMVKLLRNRVTATNGNAVIFRQGGTNWFLEGNTFDSPSGQASVRFYNTDGSEDARILNNRFLGSGNGIQLSTTNMSSLVILDNLFDGSIGSEVILNGTAVPTNMIAANNVNYIYPTPLTQIWAQNANSSDVLVKIVRTGTSSTNDVVFASGYWINNMTALSGWLWRTTTADLADKTPILGSTHYTNAEEPVGIRFNISAANNQIQYGGGTSSLNAATLHNFYTAANTITTTGTEAFRLSHETIAGRTRMWIYDVDNGQMENVTVGAADSAGAGFKVLRIPN